mgnify:CR=1 FL=1|tara:strand:+ start:195 stop:566 length:372 start_codon:yes stop_codon:yes gene_type:complete
MDEFESQDWSFGARDALSVVVLIILAAIPLLGWFLGLKFGAVLLAEAIKRKRALVWLATLAAAVPATVALAQLAVTLGMVRDPVLLILIGFAPVGILLTSITGVWVEVKRGQARRAKREVEAA